MLGQLSSPTRIFSSVNVVSMTIEVVAWEERLALPKSATQMLSQVHVQYGTEG